MVQNIHVIISKDNSITVAKLDFLIHIGTIDKHVAFSFCKHNFLIVLVCQRDMVLEDSDALDDNLTVSSASNSGST